MSNRFNEAGAIQLRKSFRKDKDYRAHNKASMRPEQFSSGNPRQHKQPLRQHLRFNEAGAIQLRKSDERRFFCLDVSELQ